jgi:hypothetical protein
LPGTPGVIAHLPGLVLSVWQVAMFRCRGLLESSPIFQDCEEGFITSLVVLLQPQVCVGSGVCWCSSRWTAARKWHLAMAFDVRAQHECMYHSRWTRSVFLSVCLPACPSARLSISARPCALLGGAGAPGGRPHLGGWGHLGRDVLHPQRRRAGAPYEATSISL